MKKLRPILFSTPMVQAIPEGRKTQTRRVVKPQPIDTNDVLNLVDNDLQYKCPYGQVGDVLWVRETVSRFSFGGCYAYKADNDPEDECTKWRPSIHMPFEACRLFLKIINIRIERLQQIGRQDALSEGIREVVELEDTKHERTYYQYKFGGSEFRTPQNAFMALWQSINGTESWDANPWVWVIEFKQITKEEALS